MPTKPKSRGTSKAPARSARKSTGGAASAVSIVAAARKAAFSTNDPALAFKHFRAIAEAVPVANLAVYAGRALVMHNNANAALSVLEPELATVAARLSDAPLREVLELPTLILALDFAANRVPSRKLSDGEIGALLSELLPLRSVMLDYLEVIAHPLVNLVPAARVQKIREGTGKLDAAQDGVAIAGVFEEFASVLAGKHPFTQQQIARLGELGATLVQQIRPGSAVATSPTRSPEAILRDQFAALVTQRYDQLLVMATVAFGSSGAAERVPALRSAAAGERATPTDSRPADGKGGQKGDEKPSE